MSTLPSASPVAALATATPLRLVAPPLTPNASGVPAIATAAPASAQTPSLGSLGLMIQNDRVYREPNNVGNIALVASFHVESIRTGKLRYRHGTTRPLHLVRLVGGTQDYKLVGSLFNPKTWEKAGTDRLVIGRLSEFRAYLDHRIRFDQIQTDDTTLVQDMWVGTVLGSDGNLKPSEQVDFPHGQEECPYSGKAFPSGNVQVLNQLGALYRGRRQRNAARGRQTDPSPHVIWVWLLWALGWVFKPILNDAYPHLVVVGDKESGKTTIADEFASRFGFRKQGSLLQFTSQYRIQKSLANTNQPVILDEIQRLGTASKWASLINTLNLAYNSSNATRGLHLQHTVGAPAMMLGQDWPCTDVALNAKTIVLPVDGRFKDPRALKTLRTMGEAPVREWVAFACQDVQQHNFCARVQHYVSQLERSLRNVAGSAEIDRTLFNYAILLATAEVARRFGVDLPKGLTICIKKILRWHVTGDQVSIGQQFLIDLANQVQTGTHALVYEIGSDGGITFNLTTALQHLTSKGYRYDVSTPKAMSRQLSLVGAQFTRRRLGAVRCRCCVVSPDILRAADVELRRTETQG